MDKFKKHKVMIGAGGGAMAAMNQSLKENKRLKGKRPSYFKNRKKDKTIYKKQIDRNANKMTPAEFETFKLSLKKEKRNKTIKNIIIITIFALLTLAGFQYVWKFL